MAWYSLDGATVANFTYPKGTSTRVVKVTLSEADYQAAKRLGDGYAAHGLREALREYLPRIEGHYK